MDTNPYDAPSTEDLASDAQGTQYEHGTGDFDIEVCLKEAWAAIKRNFIEILGVAIVTLLITFVSALTIIGYFLVLPPLMWGLAKYGFEMIDSKEKASFNTIWSGFSCYGKALGRILLVGILLYLISLPGSIISIIANVNESTSLAFVGIFVSLLWTIGVMVRFYFAPLLAVDADMPATAAISRSLTITKGLWIKMVLLLLISMVVAFVGILALGVGVIWSGPMAYLLYFSAYRQIVGRPRTAQPREAF